MLCCAMLRLSCFNSSMQFGLAKQALNMATVCLLCALCRSAQEPPVPDHPGHHRYLPGETQDVRRVFVASKSQAACMQAV